MAPTAFLISQHLCRALLIRRNFFQVPAGAAGCYVMPLSLQSLDSIDECCCVARATHAIATAILLSFLYSYSLSFIFWHKSVADT